MLFPLQIDSVLDNDMIDLLMLFFDKVANTIEYVDISSIVTYSLFYFLDNYYITSLAHFYTLMDKEFFPNLRRLNVSSICLVHL